MSDIIIETEQLDGLLAAAGEDGLREILDAFWRSTDELLAALNNQISESDFDEAARTAHAIKGSASNVGAQLLAATAKAVEAACEAKDQNGLTTNYETAVSAVGKTRDAIEERIALAS
ncbi:MAG: Hpt domain-containing protein [Pseudomonadota bacterium]